VDLATTIALIITILLLLLGVEILVVLGISTILFTVLSGQFTLENIGYATFDSLNSLPLIALPLFILTGDLISDSGISRRLVDFSRAVVGSLKGGLALTGIVASAFFAAISGSNSATAAAMGKIMVPEMDKDGYPGSFSAANVASGAIVGIIIPPSGVLIVYGAISGVSVGNLFIAGILPGLLLTTLMSLVAFTICKRNNWGGQGAFSLRSLAKTFWRANLAFVATAIILVGIYGGIFTPSEAGAVAAVYCLAVGLIVTRTIKVKDVPTIMNKSASINGMIAPIIALAIVLSQILGFLGLPSAAVDGLLALSSNSVVLTLLILILLLAAGAIMETTPNVVLLLPILAPFAVNVLGFDPVHFGMTMIVALAIGFITPPIGLNLFVASSITGIPVLEIAYRSLPYLLALLIGLLTIAFVPQITLFLVPN
jgi:C4-dicarboxylate transporter, DctM subunit